MTAQEDKATYERLVRSETTLESRLHKNLVEHVNSEIALQTITSIDSALDWLRSTFLYVRASLNPLLYGVTNDELPDQRLEQLIRQSITTLSDDGIVQDASGSGDLLSCTIRGDIMSRFYIAHKTFVSFCNIKPNSSIRDVLQLMASAKEFENLRLRAGEKQPLVEIAKRPEIRFQLSKITSVADKVSILTQVILGCVSLSDIKSEHADAAQLPIHASIVMKDAPRLLRALVDLLLHLRDAGSLRSALELQRGVNAKAWEGTANVLRQLEGIGEKSIKALSDKQIWTFEQLIRTEPRRLELLLNRQPPFGTKLIEKAQSLPSISIEMINWTEEVTAKGVNCSCELTVGLHNEGKVNANGYATVNVFCVTSDDRWIDFRRIKLSKISQCPKTFPIETTLFKQSQRILVLASVDTVAGSERRLELSAQAYAGAYPRPQWAPSAASDMPNGFFGSNEDDEQQDVPDEAPIPPSRKQPVSTPAQTQPALVEVERERLANGNYKCGHTCKKACRHLWCALVPVYRFCEPSMDSCREGLEKPPAAKKVKPAEPKEPSITPVNIGESSKAGKAAPVRKDKTARYSSLLDSLNAVSGSTKVDTLKSKPKPSRPPPKPAVKAKQPSPEIDYMDEDDLPDAGALFDEPLDDVKPLFRSPSPPAKRLLPTSESTPEAPRATKKRRTTSLQPSPSPPRQSDKVKSSSTLKSPEAEPEDDGFLDFLDSHTIE